jgi:hypothetical protein
MQEAYKDKTNYKFVTISESCIPIKSFDKFYNDIMSDNRSWVKRMNISNYDYSSRIITQKTLPFPKHLIKHYARFCLNRDHVKILLSKSYELEFFHNMQVGDEFFLSVLYPFKNSIRNFNVTYDDWDYIDLMKRDLNNKIKNIQIMQNKLPLDKGIEKNREIPIEIYNKTSWNNFMDDLIFYKVIIIFTSNTPKKELDKIDQSYLRKGRIDDYYYMDTPIEKLKKID